MNEQSNAPMSSESAQSAGFAGWFSTWMTAVTKPNEQTFATLAEHSDAMSVNRAFIWIFLAGAISALINGVFRAILEWAGFSPQSPGLADMLGGAERGIAFTLGVTICISPIAAAFSVLGFAIGVGIIQWVAGMFKGTGTYSKLAYTMAAVSVPITLLSSILTPFSSMQYVNICTGLISLIVGIYALVLEVMAVKGVNKFGWGQAAGSVFLPGLVLACCAVVVIGGMASLGSRVNDSFNSISTSVP